MKQESELHIKAFVKNIIRNMEDCAKGSYIERDTMSVVFPNNPRTKAILTEETIKLIENINKIESN